jgi:hypothetical protein
MHLKNEAARLITINTGAGPDAKKYQILPGLNPAVEVPDELAKLDFVKALLKDGSLRRVGADELEGQDDEGGGSDELDELKAQAEALGIKVAKSWKEDRIREEIAKKTAA